jgi:hypothetical protein
MEFITRFHDADTLARVCQLLREKGIPTFQQKAEGRRMGHQWALFACLDEQAEDARRVIHDPRHEPELAVDAIAFEHAIAESGEGLGLVLKWSLIIGAAVIAGFAGVVYLLSRLP